MLTQLPQLKREGLKCKIMHCSTSTLIEDETQQGYKVLTQNTLGATQSPGPSEYANPIH